MTSQHTSLNPPPIAACEGKLSWDTFSEAARAAKRGNRSRDHANAAYHCPICRHFHVGALFGGKSGTAGQIHRRKKARPIDEEQETA